MLDTSIRLLDENLKNVTARSHDVILRNSCRSSQRRNCKDDDPKYVLPDPNNPPEACDKGHKCYLIFCTFLLHCILKININPRLVVSSNRSNILHFIPAVKESLI